MATQRVCSVEGCDKPHYSKNYCMGHYRRMKKHGDPLAGGPVGEYGGPAKFFNEAVIPYTGDNCLIWPFSKGTGGRYGMMRHDGKNRLVHRLACEAIHGPAPSSSHEAAHNCGQGHNACVNPRHLQWKTHKENMGDRLEHGTDNRGRRNGKTILKEADVKFIKSMKGQITYVDLAQRFGVGYSTVAEIMRGRTWGWLT